MTHGAINSVVAAVKGFCDIHGKDSQECGAAKEAGSWVMGGLVTYGIYKAIVK